GSTKDHSFTVELGSEIDTSEGERKPDYCLWYHDPSGVKEEDASSGNDSGICMSPEYYLGSLQHSPSTSRGSPNVSLPSPGVPCGSNHPKPYDPPKVKRVIPKVNGEKLDKKLKKNGAK
ncbi:Hypothetical predicted protein, partial [Marmota monax]